VCVTTTIVPVPLGRLSPGREEAREDHHPLGVGVTEGSSVQLMSQSSAGRYQRKGHKGRNTSDAPGHEVYKISEVSQFELLVPIPFLRYTSNLRCAVLSITSKCVCMWSSYINDPLLAKNMAATSLSRILPMRAS
jgi:hypothetical protein